MALPQVVALAKLQEEKLKDHRRFNRPKLISNSLPLPMFLAKPRPPPLSSAIAPTHSLVPSSPATPWPHYRHLSPENIADCREKGLCYNCDEKFGPNHRWKACFFLLIIEDEVTDVDDGSSKEPNQELPHP